MEELLPIARDGWRFILPLLAAGIGLLFVPHWFGKSAGAVVLILAVFCLFFFRDFDRAAALDGNLIYSPADGTVMEVAELSDGTGGGRRLIRIFLSIFNVHVQRSPVDGKIEKVEYKKGNFLDARNPRAHIENEQNSIFLSTAQGTIKVTQIAGLIARRIVCWNREGDSLKQGARYGLIRFGSQVDMEIPAAAQVTVKVGDAVHGGITVVAKWK